MCVCSVSVSRRGKAVPLRCRIYLGLFFIIIRQHCAASTDARRARAFFAYTYGFVWVVAAAAAAARREDKFYTAHCAFICYIATDGSFSVYGFLWK